MDAQDIKIMMDDIRSIKSAVRKHDRAFKELLLPRYFAPMSIYLGLSVIAIMAAFQLLSWRFGSYGDIPVLVRTLLWVFSVFVAISGSFMKWLVFSAATRRISGEKTLQTLFEELYVDPLQHVFFAMIAAILVGGCFLGLRGYGLFIIPYAGVLMGLVWNLIGGTIKAKEYLITGYWLTLSGSASFFFVESLPFLVPAFIFGLGFTLFGFLGLFNRARTKDKGGEDRD